MDPVTVNCTIIDWCDVTAILFSTFMAAFFTVLFGGIIALGINWYRRRQFRIQEEVLFDLAELRTEGVDYRNVGIDKPFDEGEFELWGKIIDDWYDALLTTAKWFSPVEAERLRTLDRVPNLMEDGFEKVKLAEIARSNPAQLKRINETSEVLRRLDQMLEQRFRPTQSP